MRATADFSGRPKTDPTPGPIMQTIGHDAYGTLTILKDWYSTTPQSPQQGLRAPQRGLQDPSAPLRELVVSEASLDEFRDACRKSGMRTLRETGLKSIHDGLTTIEEIVRETILDED